MLRSLRVENLVLIREAELELDPGLNVITGETGAGKTILAQAFGLLLGARGDASLVGPGATDAYVEADLDAPPDLLEDDQLASLRELRPDDEAGIVLARRVFADGRSRAYAWGRASAREDVARAAERLVAMSGQFEQRRLARGSYQLDVLDAFAGEEQLRRRAELRRAWRELGAARSRHAELALGARAVEERLAELRALVEDTDGFQPDLEERLREERERLRHLAEFLSGSAEAAEVLDPDDGDGAAAKLAAAAQALAPVERLAPELARVAGELRDLTVRARESAHDLRRFLASLEADPSRLEEVEAELGRIADAKRRFGCSSLDELLGRAREARAELAGFDTGADPAAVAAEALAAAEAAVAELAWKLHEARAQTIPRFAAEVSAGLEGIGVSGGFRVELRERPEPGPSGSDEVAFLVKPNPGLPFSPVAETASGGELSRIALAIAAVAGGETMVFDEIDAGIGGRTAHAVADMLVRLARRAQVITITHLPQIASRADRHFRVEKVPGDPTHTRIEQLDGEERREEIERMLGGREFLSLVSEGREREAS